MNARRPSRVPRTVAIALAALTALAARAYSETPRRGAPPPPPPPPPNSGPTVAVVPVTPVVAPNTPTALGVFNTSPFGVCALYLAPAGTQRWSGDLLVNIPVHARQSAFVTGWERPVEPSRVLPRERIQLAVRAGTYDIRIDGCRGQRLGLFAGLSVTTATELQLVAQGGRVNNRPPPAGFARIVLPMQEVMGAPPVSGPTQVPVIAQPRGPVQVPVNAYDPPAPPPVVPVQPVAPPSYSNNNGGSFLTRADGNDLRHLCSHECGFIGDNDLRHYCSHECGFIGDNDLRSLCGNSCGFIQDPDLRHLCGHECGFIRDNDLRNLCSNQCGFIQNPNVRSLCGGGCGFIH